MMDNDLYIGWDELLHYDTKLKEYLEDKLSNAGISEDTVKRIVQELLTKYVTIEDAQAAKSELVAQIDKILSDIAELDASKVDESEFETFQTSIFESVGKLETDLTANIENTFESVSLTISDLKDSTEEEFAKLSKVVADNDAAVDQRFDLVEQSIASAQATAIQKAIEQASTQDAAILAEAQRYAESLGSNYDESGAADAVKAELTEILDNKVEKATTLAGYGISDAYTKEEVSNQDAVVLAEAQRYTKELIDKLPEQVDYTVEITENTEDSSVAKTYVFTQNGREIGNIKIDKKLVVTSGTVRTVVEVDVPYAGAAVGDKYIDLEIANQTEHIYIPAKDLVDIYTAQSNASEVQVAISNTNEISATLVNSGITEDKLGDDVKAKLNKSWEEAGVAQSLVDELANGQVKTNTDAIKAINDADTGILKQAKSYTDELLTDYATIEDMSTQDAVVLAESEQYTDNQDKFLRSELLDLIDEKQPAGNYAPAQHNHSVADIIEFRKNVAETVVNEAVKSTKDGDGNVISETYAKKATTLADYGITDAYTREEVAKQDAVVLVEAEAYADSKDSLINQAVEKNTASLTILQGGSETEGSVAKQISDAITNLKLPETYEPLGAAQAALDEATLQDAAVLAEVQSYTDTKVSELAEGAVKANTEDIATLKEIDHTAFASKAEMSEVASQVNTISTFTDTDGKQYRFWFELADGQPRIAYEEIITEGSN